MNGIFIFSSLNFSSLLRRARCLYARGLPAAIKTHTQLVSSSFPHIVYFAFRHFPEIHFFSCLFFICSDLALIFVVQICGDCCVGNLSYFSFLGSQELKMRNPKGRKGKKEQNGSPKDLTRGSTKASPRGKRVKAPATAKQQLQPETFPDHRNMEDLWQAAFPVGTEWDQLDSVYRIHWDFSNLEKAFEEGEVLCGKKVYLFGCTEPQLVFFEGQGKVICIPVVVAVTSPFPPSDKIGIKSVQMEGETVVPMKQMKMNWVPYIPFENRLSSVERLKTQIFTLRCTQRRAALKQLNQEQIKKYEYCLPHFYQPLKEDEIEQDTVVQIMYPMEPPIVCDFDWEFDDLEELTDSLIQEESLPADQKDEFKKFVKERVTESKKKQREAREARKKAIEEMSPESKAAFESMRFYKFYPVQTPTTPDISNVKVPFINRYYGKAHMVL